MLLDCGNLYHSLLSWYLSEEGVKPLGSGSFYVFPSIVITAAVGFELRFIGHQEKHATSHQTATVKSHKRAKND